MSTLTSIPISDPKRFLALQDGYKQELMGDLRLEEASALAARRQLLLLFLKSRRKEGVFISFQSAPQVIK